MGWTPDKRVKQFPPLDDSGDEDDNIILLEVTS
jgi:hypothetical protein